jgi:hypothetical protein
VGSLALTQLISLVVVVAAISATGGFITSAVVRRKKRRARGIFVLGFFCGLMAGSVLVTRRRGQGVQTLTLAASRIRHPMSPPFRRRSLPNTAAGPARLR